MSAGQFCRQSVARYSTFQHVKPHPLTYSIGAELEGVDLRKTIPHEVGNEIKKALWQYGVVFFRDQEIDEPQHINLASLFGQPVRATNMLKLITFAYIAELSNLQ